VPSAPLSISGSSYTRKDAPIFDTTFACTGIQVKPVAGQACESDQLFSSSRAAADPIQAPTVCLVGGDPVVTTEVGRLELAGRTMAEICAISGHSTKSVETIIRHYLGATRELADADIDKLTAGWRARGLRSNARA
jgi:hypothetical protein